MRKWPEEERIEHSVYAVSAGYPVTWSSEYDSRHDNYFLDYKGSEYNGWCAKINTKNEWIQVNSDTPHFWTGIIMQGRGGHNQWVTSIKISYSLNGRDWTFVEKGKVFKANSDMNTYVPIEFCEPVYARVLRIHP